MTKMQKMAGLILSLACVAGAAGLAFAFMDVSQSVPREERGALDIVCGGEEFQWIKYGMTQDQMRERFGSPHEDVVKRSVDEYRFGQGDLESQIKSGWIYRISDDGMGMEIYFDKDGMVIGKNCGHG